MADDGELIFGKYPRAKLDRSKLKPPVDIESMMRYSERDDEDLERWLQYLYEMRSSKPARSDVR